MIRKSYVLLALVLCFAFLLAGCPKKTVTKDEPGMKKADEASKSDADRAAREKAEREAREKAAKAKEDAARKEELDKTLVAKKEPGLGDKTIYETPLLKDIYFDFDKYDVRPSEVQALKDDAAFLMKYPNVKIQIEGHCDERGTAEYNLALGERRANSAKKFLVSAGVPETRISTISYGKEKPFDPGHNEAAWAKNRRAHFIILSK